MFEISFYAVLGLSAGAMATFALATMLPDEVQRSSERNGRYAYLGGCDDLPLVRDGRPIRAALQRATDVGSRGGWMRSLRGSFGTGFVLPAGRRHRALPLRARRARASAAYRMLRRSAAAGTTCCQ